MIGAKAISVFDFIILSKTCIYLGESKWNRSSELSNAGSLDLRAEQVMRHRVFAFYVQEWAFGQYESWDKFFDAEKKFASERINKPLAPTDSLLASNLKTVLGIIRRHFAEEPQIINLILYLYDGSKGKPPNKTVSEFRLVSVDYSGFAEGNFIPIEI